MRRLVTLLVITVLAVPAIWAQESRTKELERVEASQKVLREIMAAPDNGIPQEILAGAECVAVIPSMLKGGFIVGARYGRGVATCRNGARWSGPAPVRIEGGSWGLQIGGQAVDLVMLVMNKQGLQNLLDSKFKIGADASAAAGPVGRHVEGSTDWKMRAQVLTYSRARGAFAGVTLNGAVVKQDTDDTLALYGKFVPFESILHGKVPAPAGTQKFVTEVASYFREAKSDQSAKKTAPSSGSSGSAGTAGGTSASATQPSGSKSDTGTTGSVAGGTQSSTTTTTGSTATETGTTSGSQSPEQIKKNISDALQNTGGVSSQNVQLNVTSDTVTISGSVPTAKDRATVRRIVEENAGGRKVDDSNLSVK